MFGGDCVQFENKQLRVTVDGCTVNIDPVTRVSKDDKGTG
jgi:hypothetical protein